VINKALLKLSEELLRKMGLANAAHHRAV
jgi:hypothetical protein